MRGYIKFTKRPQAEVSLDGWSEWGRGDKCPANPEALVAVRSRDGSTTGVFEARFLRTLGGFVAFYRVFDFDADPGTVVGK